MKNINIEEVKRYLKRSLKKKVKITTSLIVLFMMRNSIVSMADNITIDKGKIGVGRKNDYNKGAIALNPKGENDSKPQKEVVGNYSIAIGLGAEAGASDSVSIGHSSKAKGANSVVIGSVYEGYDIDLITNQPKKDEKGNPKRLDSFTTAEGEDSIAIGSGAYVHQSTNGGQGIFDNGKQRATESSIAIGTNAGTGVYRSIAIGNTAEAVPIKMFDSDYKKR